MAKPTRHLGSIYTPEAIAQYLASWAIRNRHDKVLDIGSGEGIFVFSAYSQLRSLETSSHEAETQIFGAEIDGTTYERFLTHVRQKQLWFPNVQHKDFFDIEFPEMDVVIGNPPYVRRTYLDSVDEIREKIVTRHPDTADLKLPRSTDLYVYFLLSALATLKPGGRVAVIVADAWLTVGYGDPLKEYIKKHLDIDCLISFDRRVFEDAQVKPVILLASKKELVTRDKTISFVRIKNGLPIEDLDKLLEMPQVNNRDIGLAYVNEEDLVTSKPWSIYFKAPEVYDLLASHELMSPMATVATTRIGVQTLAKDFFVLSREQAHTSQIEPEYLEPLAQSPRFLNGPVIEQDHEPMFYLFYCSKSEESLAETRAGEYIKRGEQETVDIRGKNASIVGYHRKERIVRSSRKYWYDLKSSVERRGRAEILIPRLLYESYMVVWNKAYNVPGELFIEFFPLPLADCKTEVYLAILSSSITEIMLRVHAQVYGGGTYNINPGEIRNVPILNGGLLTNEQKEDLAGAYEDYLLGGWSDRSLIDKIVYNILAYDDEMQEKLNDLLEDLVHIAGISKKRVPGQI